MVRIRAPCSPSKGGPNESHAMVWRGVAGGAAAGRCGGHRPARRAPGSRRARRRVQGRRRAFRWTARPRRIKARRPKSCGRSTGTTTWASSASRSMSIPTLGVSQQEQAAGREDPGGHPGEDAARARRGGGAAQRRSPTAWRRGRSIRRRSTRRSRRSPRCRRRWTTSRTTRSTSCTGCCTPPEREALALKVQAHYMIWERANADEKAQPDQEQEGGQIHHLAPVLGLAPDQVQKIDAAFTASMASGLRGEEVRLAGAAEEHLQAFVDRLPGGAVRRQDADDGRTRPTRASRRGARCAW